MTTLNPALTGAQALALSARRDPDVRGYVAHPLSLRHLEEMMAERRIPVDRSTVHCPLSGIELMHMIAKGQMQDWGIGYTHAQQFCSLAT